MVFPHGLSADQVWVGLDFSLILGSLLFISNLECGECEIIPLGGGGRGSSVGGTLLSRNVTESLCRGL